MSNASKHVLIVAGEASGDLHGSNLVSAMKKIDPEISIRGIGGDKMMDAGVDILAHASDMAVVGLTEAISKLHFIYKTSLGLKRLIKNSRPDLLILIDYPDFNINLARTARQCSVPVLYYVSPQIWAWRSGRIKKIAARVDRMAVILPFEKEFYRDSDLKVDYVGHPLLDSVPKGLDRDQLVVDMDLNGASPVIGFLPGSRKEEVLSLLPVMVKAAEALASHYPGLKCIIPVAPTISPELVLSIIGQSDLDIRISRSDIYKTLAVCDLALVASGTATLETAIMEVPMVIIYKISPLSYWIGKKIINVPYIGLVNLIAGKEVVPELVQKEVTPEIIEKEVIAILGDNPRRELIINDLKMVKHRMGSGGASERTARIAMEMIENFSQ